MCTCVLTQNTRAACVHLCVQLASPVPSFSERLPKLPGGTSTSASQQSGMLPPALATSRALCRRSAEGSLTGLIGLSGLGGGGGGEEHMLCMQASVGGGVEVGAGASLWKGPLGHNT